MNLPRLILREIVYRKWSFVLALLAVAAAVGCLVGELTILRLHDQATAQLLESRQRETDQRLAREDSAWRVRWANFKAETEQGLDRERHSGLSRADELALLAALG